MLATFQAGKGAAYSIIYPSDYSVTKMVQLKLLQKLDHSRLVGLDNIMPKFQKSVHDPDNQYSVPVSWGTTGFIYNSEKLNPPPTDWSYLWSNERELARRMTLLNDVREVMGGVLKSLGHSYNSTSPQDIRQAYEKLAILKPAIATFTTDAWRDQLVAGDLLLAMGYSVDAVLVAKQDAKFKYVIPDSGTSLWSDTMVIPKTARILMLLMPGLITCCNRLSRLKSPNDCSLLLLTKQPMTNFPLPYVTTKRCFRLNRCLRNLRELLPLIQQPRNCTTNFGRS